MTIPNPAARTRLQQRRRRRLGDVIRVLISAVLISLVAGAPLLAPARAPAGAPGAPPLPTAQPLPGPAGGEVGSRRDGPGTPVSPDAPRFGWPLPGRPVVARLFEAPEHRFGPGHRGVDLAAPAGTPVLAAGAGVVVFAGAVAGRTVVSIDHPGGLRTTYEPVTPEVRAGDVVPALRRIGTLQPGHPDCAAAACLHWGVRRAADYLDPLRLLGFGRVRLLPWQDAPG